MSYLGYSITSTTFWFLVITSCILLIPVAQSETIKTQHQKTRIYLLGEIHDNPQSHSLRLSFVKNIISQGHRPVLVMEQFDRENQHSLNLALASCADADCVVERAATPGWNWSFYKPFVQLALEKKVTLLAGNLSNSDVNKVVMAGFSALYTSEFINLFKLDQLLPELVKIQNEAVNDGHCGMLPAQAVAAMVNGQIARDVWMAIVVQKNVKDIVVLIAGNGHVRKDAGVYQWLTKAQKDQTQVHGFVESKAASDSQWYDQTHLMQSVKREDPCLVFKK